MLTRSVSFRNHAELRDLCYSRYRTKNLGYAALSTEWSTDIPYKSRAHILWAPDGRYLALHDRLNKHSAVSIYHRLDEKFTTLAVPDLLDEACRRWKLSRLELANSGQRPFLWEGNDTLAIEVNAKNKNGRTLSTILYLKISDEGVVTITKK